MLSLKGHSLLSEARSRGEEMEEFISSNYSTLIKQARESKKIKPEDFAKQADQYINQLQEDGATIASRKASQNSLNLILSPL